jgi:methyltransferase
VTLQPLWLVELLVGVTAVQRLLELRLSRRNITRLSSAARDADPAVNFGVLVGAQALWLAGCALEPALRGALPVPALAWSGVVLFLAGALLRVWCIRALGSAWNARARVDPGLRIVTHGPYRWIRHPNYLGVLLELVGLPLAGGAWWTLAASAPVHAWVLLRRIRGEDALLFALPGYAEAMGQKGALVPRCSWR